MGQSDPSKTEAATPKRIRKAREEGNVAKSQELPKFINLLIGTVVLLVYMDFMARQFQDLMRYFLEYFNEFEATPEEVYALFLWVSKTIAIVLLPVMLAVGVAVYAVLRWQVGSLWTTKVFQFKWDRFNLINGLKRMLVSPETFMRLGKSLIMALVIGVIPYMILRREFDKFILLYYTDAAGLASYMLNLGYTMVKYVLGALLIIAAFDTWYSKFKYSENLKMTKQEVKDEARQAEGDPQIRMQQRRKMMEMMAKRMLQDVPKADVVITNPTHYAVALRYNAMEAPAPVVVAKGVDHMARRIREIAQENNVPLRENKLLARSLYEAVEVGDMIPENMYKAVASILSNLVKFKAKRRTR